MTSTSAVSNILSNVARLLAMVSLIAVILTIAACAQGDQVRDTTDSTDAEVDVPRSAVGLLSTDASEFSVVDVEQVLDGEAPSDYRDQLEDQWSDALLDIGVKFEDVSTMVVGTVDGDDLIILKGDFDFEYVRDALSDSDFQESDYRDFELWEDDRTGTAALIEGDEYVLFGAAAVPLSHLTRAGGRVFPNHRTAPAGLTDSAPSGDDFKTPAGEPVHPPV